MKEEAPSWSPHPRLRRYFPQGGKRINALSPPFGGSTAEGREGGSSGEPLSVRLIALAHESWKYLLVSVVALAVDYGLMVALTEWAGLNYLVSAAAGFGAGLIVNYALSVTLVFSQRRLASRRLEFVGFFLIGIVGLGLNEILMKTFVELLHLDYRLAKIPAAGIGFVFNFGTRRVLLFTAARDPGPPADDA